MTIEVKVIEDSIDKEGYCPRLTTLELRYPRFIHSEFMTHRVFSRNASSSRAIPTKRMHQSIAEDSALPSEWRMNEAGMQGFTSASPDIKQQAEEIMDEARACATGFAQRLEALGLHKQHVNRLTEPFQHIRVVCTSVFWDNFLALRLDKGAEPTMQALAQQINLALKTNAPVLLERGEWHLPYIDTDAFNEVQDYVEGLKVRPLPTIRNSVRHILKRVSAARCARVSYNNFEGRPSGVEEDLALYDKLMRDQPIHASPTEHQATPDWRNTYRQDANHGKWANPRQHGNLVGWQQFRKFQPNETLDAYIGD